MTTPTDNPHDPNLDPRVADLIAKFLNRSPITLDEAHHLAASGEELEFFLAPCKTLGAPQ